jgi:hypothetical protein
MVTVIIDEQNVLPVYPKLMLSKLTGTVWLVINENTGIVIQKGKDSHPEHQLGYINNDLLIKHFIDYNLAITIKNC